MLALVLVDNKVHEQVWDIYNFAIKRKTNIFIEKFVKVNIKTITLSWQDGTALFGNRFQLVELYEK